MSLVKDCLHSIRQRESFVCTVSDRERVLSAQYQTEREFVLVACAIRE